MTSITPAMDKYEDLVKQLEEEWLEQSERCGEEDAADRAALAYDSAVALRTLQTERDQDRRDAKLFWFMVANYNNAALHKAIREYPRGSEDDMRECIGAFRTTISSNSDPLA